jgi:hypothetical protein
MGGLAIRNSTSVLGLVYRPLPQVIAIQRSFIRL